MNFLDEVKHVLEGLNLKSFSSMITGTPPSERQNEVMRKVSNTIKTSSDALIDAVSAMNIAECKNLNLVSRSLMNRLMAINIYEKYKYFEKFGDSIPYQGNSEQITSEALRPTYAEEINYVSNFAGDIASDEIMGVNATSVRAFDQDGIHSTNINLYPDDSDTLEVNPSEARYDRWELDNQNSILAKTKTLFRLEKMNTIISRFATDGDGGKKGIVPKGSATTQAYGMSHGRNLLIKNPQSAPTINGYLNPYCRVWTHHHQYSKLNRLIRPFAKDENTNGTPADFHTWGSSWKTVGGDGKMKFGWKSSNADAWTRSVLGKNGFVNIAPKYVNGGATNVHTKDCMFSIENLAWQGYNPYEFEKALSWEQRGPMGGRIMWFPPYDLSFSESTSADWDSKTFIGRGEPVFTYRNTTRSGNLRFTLVVDHPSIVDYVTWHLDSEGRETILHNDRNVNGSDNISEEFSANNKQNNNVTDDDFLRFFAGCDAGRADSGGYSLIDKTMPTPLTDEYIENAHEKKEVKNVEVNKKPEPIELPNIPVPPTEPVPDGEKEGTIAIAIYYPNNYSGSYDNGVLGSSNVDPISYLLAGTNAQKSARSIKAHDIAINYDTIKDGNFGRGYEMKADGPTLESSKEYFPIIGCEQLWKTAIKKHKYNPSRYKIWYYRIDGKYEVPASEAQPKGCTKNSLVCKPLDNVSCPDYFANKYDQKISKIGMTIKKSDKYNLVAQKTKLIEKMCPDIDENNIYSLTEAACAMDEKLEKALVGHYGEDIDEGKINVLRTLLSNTDNKLTVEYYGFANSQGIATTENNAKMRNSYLAKGRCETGRLWFMDKIQSLNTNVEHGGINFDVVEVKNQNNITSQNNHEQKDARAWRSCLIKIKYKINSSTSVAETNQNTESNATSTVDSATLRGLHSYINSFKGEYNDFTTDDEDSDARIKFCAVCSNLLNENDPTIKVNNSKYIEECGKNKVEAKDAGENGIVERYDGILAYLNTIDREINGTGTYQKYLGYTEAYKDADGKVFYKDEKGEIWMEEEDGKLVKKSMVYTYTERYKKGTDKKQKNTYRYDQEYHFFRVLQATDPVVFDKLIKKLQYFDPAFHSMTPEGFNGRLAFLHQCTRQGPTVGASDVEAQSANNLAFGRPPFCVLRIGDFFNTVIVIKNISIQYDPLTWDLNTEGIGVQPLLAKVDLTIDFVGGSDISGPIKRLQNAVSFNYYANQRFYDNRADRTEYDYDYTNKNGAPGGAVDHHNITSYADYNPSMHD